MKKNESKAKSKRPVKVTPVTAGIAGAAAGAAVGAGVAVAATQALKNKDTKQKVQNVVKTVRKQAEKYIDDMKESNMKQGRKALGNMVQAASKKVQGNSHASNSKSASRRKANEGNAKKTQRPSTHA